MATKTPKTKFLAVTSYNSDAWDFEYAVRPIIEKLKSNVKLHAWTDSRNDKTYFYTRKVLFGETVNVQLTAAQLKKVKLAASDFSVEHIVNSNYATA